MRKSVSDETLAYIEEQFADCTSFEEVTFLYSDFERIIGNLMSDRHSDLAEEFQKCEE